MGDHILAFQARLAFAVIFSVSLLAFDWRAAAQVRGTLSDVEIAEAIALGSRSDPEAYLLRHDGRPDNPVVVGLIYSPFLRVALLANMTARKGASLTSADVDPRLIDPVVDIAFRWYCCDEFSPTTAEFDPLAGPEPELFAVPPGVRAKGGFGRPEERLKPLRTSRSTAALERFGAVPIYNDIVAVATFPVTVLQPDWAFVVSKVQPSGRLFVRTGVIRSLDWQGWR